MCPSGHGAERTIRPHTGARSFSPAPPSLPTHVFQTFYFLAYNGERINGKSIPLTPLKPRFSVHWQPQPEESSMGPKLEQATTTGEKNPGWGTGHSGLCGYVAAPTFLSP